MSGTSNFGLRWVLIALGMAALLTLPWLRSGNSPGLGTQTAASEMLRSDGSGLVSQLGGPATAVAVYEGLSILGLGNRLVALDLADAATPRVVAESAALPAPVRSLLVEADQLYIALGAAGWQAFDISDLAVKGFDAVGSAESEWWIEDLHLGKDLLVAADGQAGMRLWRPNDDRVWQLVATVDTPGDARSVDGQAGLLVVADGGTGIRVYDMDGGDRPTLLAAVDTPGMATDLALSGSSLYVADGAAGMHVYDLSQPQRPRLLSTFASLDFCERIVVVGQDAYLADRQGGIAIVDVADASAPVERFRFRDVGAAVDLAVLDARVLVADAGAYRAGGSLSSLNATQAHVWGLEGQAPRAGGFAGLRILAAGPGATLEQTAVYRSPSFVESLAWDDGIAYLADGYAGLVLADLRDPTAPRLLGSAATEGAAHDVLLTEEHAWVADGAAGIASFDRLVGPRLRELGRADTPGEALGLALSGDYLYVADGDAGVTVVDVSDASRPRLLTTLDTPGFAWDLQLDGGGGWLYVADRVGGLRIFDLDEPGLPKAISSVQSAAVAMGLAISPDYAFVASGPAGLSVVDLADRRSPALVARLPIPGVAQGLALIGDRAYVAAGDQGMRVVDISEPLDPREIDAFPLPGISERIVVRRDHAMIASEHGGLLSLRISPTPSGLWLPWLLR